MYHMQHDKIASIGTICISLRGLTSDMHVAGEVCVGIAGAVCVGIASSSAFHVIPHVISRGPATHSNKKTLGLFTPKARAGGCLQIWRPNFVRPLPRRAFQPALPTDGIDPETASVVGKKGGGITVEIARGKRGLYTKGPLRPPPPDIDLSESEDSSPVGLDFFE